MKCKFTLFYFLLFLTLGVSAQNLTGIWKGYFVQNSIAGFDDRYRFEMQIEQLGNNAINGVTYSYKTTVFYGKASLSGLYTKNTKTLTVTETKLIEVKIKGETQACLMTCYLDYSKMGDLETLTGTYTSQNLTDKGDCGSGKVYLEKTPVSDFYKEDFLVKREYEASKKKAAATKKAPSSKPVLQSKPTLKTSPPKNSVAINKTTSKTVPPKKTVALNKPALQSTTAKKPSIKPGAENNIIKTPENKIAPPTTAVLPPRDETVQAPKPTLKVLPKPDVIRKRNNELIKTYYTSAKEIKIDLYDNGEIDGDTISVYDNNKLIISKKRLTDKPISYVLKTDENEPVHEFVMVAENLGSIPPNTALMIITAGEKRYELFVTSTEQKNAVVVVEYKPEKS